MFSRPKSQEDERTKETECQNGNLFILISKNNDIILAKEKLLSDGRNGEGESVRVSKGWDFNIYTQRRQGVILVSVIQ